MSWENIPEGKKRVVWPWNDMAVGQVIEIQDTRNATNVRQSVSRFNKRPSESRRFKCYKRGETYYLERVA